MLVTCVRGSGGLRAVSVSICAAVLVLSGCGSSEREAPQTTAAGPPKSIGPPAPDIAPPAPDIFSDVNKILPQLIPEKTTWHQPANAIEIDQPTEIGLQIGTSDELNRAIEQRLPNTIATPAGTVKVGPTITVTLDVVPHDAVEIDPDKPIDKSAPPNIAQLWTWFITPKKAKDLKITATVESRVDVPGAGGARSIPFSDQTTTLEIHVHASPWWRIQHFWKDNWQWILATISALVGFIGWLFGWWKRLFGRWKHYRGTKTKAPNEKTEKNAPSPYL
jgi:hypothetical protein